MKKLLHLLTAATAPVLAIALASPANAAIKSTNQKSDVFKFAPISKYEQKHGRNALTLEDATNQNKVSSKKSKTIITEDDLTDRLPACYALGYLDAPDGSTWYYTEDIEYDEVDLEGGYATEKHITGYKFTIYNSNYQALGSFSDKIVLGENETKIAGLQIGPCVTQKFFNSDSNYEFMVMISANTPSYTNHTYTKVYSLGSETEGAIETIEDYYSNAINVGTYSEKYYMSFCHEGEEPAENIENYTDYGYEAGDTVYCIKNVVYGPKTYSSEREVKLKTIHTPYDYIEGSDGIPFLAAANNGVAYFANVRYEKAFFKNPGVSIDMETGTMTRDTAPTPDNNMIVDIYKATYSGLTLDHSTKIPMKIVSEEGTQNLFYEMGAFFYNNDLDFEIWGSDGKPALIVTIENYATSSDTSTYTYMVYDLDGNEIGTLATDVEALIDISDIPGFEKQEGFYKENEDGEYVFQFVEMPSFNVAATLKVVMDDNTLTGYGDRYPKGDSYVYAFSLATGMNDNDEGDTIHYIRWFNTDGTVDHDDKLNLGTNIAMIQPYIKTAVLNPYLFNTDDKIEYMLLVKTYLFADSSTTSESFKIINEDSETLSILVGDDDLGYLVNIVLIDNEKNPAIWLTYENDDTDTYSSVFMNLPLSKFEKGGDGTANNPYLISTAGDLQQIRTDLTANYKIVNDIDASKCMFTTISGDFTGTLDGANHAISHFTLGNSNYYNGIFESLAGGATIKDLTFNDVNVILTSSNDESGLLAAEARGETSKAPSISNVHVYGYNASVSDETTGSFGGLVGMITNGTKITDSSIQGASFDINNDKVGGIVAETRTGSTVKNCAFDGWIAGNAVVGGIVGKATTGDETITNNHVSANLEGANTIGGIVGDAGRASIANNLVQVTLNATTNNKWGKGAMVGGIVGALEEDWTNASTPIVTNNVAYVYSINVPEYPEDEWENESTTTHRIVGFTCFNDEPGKTVMPADAGIINNYALSSTNPFDSNIGSGANTTEGESISEDQITKEFLTNLGFAFGSNSTSPWKYTTQGAYLYYQDPSKTGVEDVSVEPSYLQQTVNGFSAEGCTLSVYNMCGVKVASAANSISTLTLTPGVYVVSAVKDGKAASTAKFVIK